VKIASYRFYPEDLTVAEITHGDSEPWAFLPFEDQPADIDPLDDDCVLARGHSGGFAIFNGRTRSKTNEVRAPLSQRLGWTYGPVRRAAYILDGTEANGKLNGIRELPLDDRPSAFHLVAPDFYTINLAKRDDGRLILTSHQVVAAFDVATGDVEMHPYPGFTASWRHSPQCRPRWFSPDGRLMLRPHLGSVVRSDGDDTDHTDLPGDGVRRYAVALDVWETGPVVFRQRLILQYLTAEQFDPHDKFLAAEIAPTLDELADTMPHRSRDGASQQLMTDAAHSKDPAVKLRDEHVSRLVFRVKDVTWDADSAGFSVILEGVDKEVRYLTRHVGLNGDVGPLEPSDWKERSRPTLPSEPAIKRIQKDVRARAVQRIAIPDLSPESLLRACESMAPLIEGRLESAVFCDTLQFRFKVGAGKGSKTIDERALFKLVRALGAAALAPFVAPLRRVLTAFGAQARDHVCTAGTWITDGGEPETARAALSEAAWTLALHDDAACEVLRDWFQAVDQSFDGFAANTVFTAIAKRTAFATPEAARFGVWFCMRQWQGTAYDPNALGLIEACRQRWSPADFAVVLKEELAAVENGWGPDRNTLSREGCPDRIAELLGSAAWDEPVRGKLARLRRA